jgi:dihydrofolate synthase/folylpolyglutamate synthase
MNYPETLSYLFDQLPVFQRIGAAAYRKDMSNTRRLADMCENPEIGLKCVHIAGTNGKGSTAHGMASVMQHCGHKTGLMTSPHYKDFRERIKIDGKMIDKDYVVDWVAKHQRRFEAIKPSFFELTVIMGFCYFRDMGVDIAIVETGMGGRLDSTNIVKPELSIITVIGMDHSEFLGDTYDAIAREKAGIIKEKTPVLIASGNEHVMHVFQDKAEQMSAPLRQVNPPLNPIHTDLGGEYQQANMSTVLHAVELLKDSGWTLPDSKVISGLASVTVTTGILGRWQLLQKNPSIIADSAHNPAGIKAVVRNLKACKFESLHIVVGMVSDKDVDAVLDLLPFNATYYFCQAKVMRALACDMLAQQGQRMGLVGECYGSIQAALTAAKDAADSEDLILITGSVFTVAEVV